MYVNVNKATHLQPGCRYQTRVILWPLSLSHCPLWSRSPHTAAAGRSDLCSAGTGDCGPTKQHSNIFSMSHNNWFGNTVILCDKTNCSFEFQNLPCHLSQAKHATHWQTRSCALAPHRSCVPRRPPPHRTPQWLGVCPQPEPGVCQFFCNQHKMWASKYLKFKPICALVPARSS